MKSTAQLSDIDINKISEWQNKKLLEKFKCRRLFWYASPQISQVTIPKEFIINTSELKEVQCKNTETLNHAKSHDWSSERKTKEQAIISPLELPIATYDENFSAQNSRQAGNYKWSFWKLQQVKSNYKKAISANYNINLDNNQTSEGE